MSKQKNFQIINMKGKDTQTNSSNLSFQEESDIDILSPRKKSKKRKISNDLEYLQHREKIDNIEKRAEFSGDSKEKDYFETKSNEREGDEVKKHLKRKLKESEDSNGSETSLGNEELKNITEKKRKKHKKHENFVRDNSIKDEPINSICFEGQSVYENKNNLLDNVNVNNTFGNVSAKNVTKELRSPTLEKEIGNKKKSKKMNYGEEIEENQSSPSKKIIKTKKERKKFKMDCVPEDILHTVNVIKKDQLLETTPSQEDMFSQNIINSSLDEIPIESTSPEKSKSKKKKKKHKDVEKDLSFMTITCQEDSFDENIIKSSLDEIPNESISAEKSKVKKKRKKHRDVEPTKDSKSIIKGLSEGMEEKSSSLPVDLVSAKRVEDEPSSSSKINQVQSKSTKNKPLISMSSLDTLLSKFDEITKENKNEHIQKKKGHESDDHNDKMSDNEIDKSGYFSSTFLEGMSSDSTLNSSGTNTKDLKKKLLDDLTNLSECSSERISSFRPQEKINPFKESIQTPSTSSFDFNGLITKVDRIVKEEYSLKKPEESRGENEQNENIEHSNQKEEEESEHEHTMVEVDLPIVGNFEEDSDSRIAAMVETLEGIDFEVPWALPAIHRIVTSAVHGPTQDQKKLLEEQGIELKLGKYTKEEDQKIRDNWKLFCHMHDWDEKCVEPFLKHGNMYRKKFTAFVQFLSHNFEDRAMYYIYLRFVRLFEKFNSKNFTPDEDEFIIDYVENSCSKHPYAYLATKLNRSRNSVLKRYRKLSDEFGNIGKINWDRWLTKELLLNLLQVTGAKRLSELKNRTITTVEWKMVASKMNIYYEKLLRLWDGVLYTRIFHPDFDESFPEIRDKLVQRLSRKYNDWREINWIEEAKKFDSFKPMSLYRMFNDLVNSRVPKEKRNDFKACLDYIRIAPVRHVHGKFTFIQELVEEIENQCEDTC